MTHGDKCALQKSCGPQERHTLDGKMQRLPSSYTLKVPRGLICVSIKQKMC